MLLIVGDVGSDDVESVSEEELDVSPDDVVKLGGVVLGEEEGEDRVLVKVSVEAGHSS